MLPVGKGLIHLKSFLLRPRDWPGRKVLIRKSDHFRAVNKLDTKVFQVSNGHDQSAILVRTTMVADGDNVVTHAGVRVDNVEPCTWPKVLRAGSKLCLIGPVRTFANDVCDDTPNWLGHALFTDETAVLSR